MTPFTQQVIEIIKSIPKGSVMTYGQIAALAGNPRGSRQVVRILHSLSIVHSLPWYRVVNRKGEIAILDEAGRAEQIFCLREEGVAVSDEGTVDLAKYLHRPPQGGSDHNESV